MTAKKFISVFLTLCMLLTLGSGLSLSAFAEGETWTDVGTIDALRTAAATDGAYIRLTADITFSEGRAVDVPAETTVTLDLNGHAVSRGLTGINASSNRYGNVLTVEGKLTIEDSSGDNSGKITGGYCTMHGGGINVTRGELILNGGSICDNVVSPANGRGGGVLVNNGSFTMNGGLIYDNSAGSGDTSTGGCGGGVGLIRSTFTMNGGRIFSCGTRTGQYNVNRNSTSAFGGAVYVGIDSTFKMTDGQLGGMLSVSANQGLDNQAFKAGAAVYVVGYSESSQGDTYPAGAFYMTGGTITGSYCPGDPGGAVYLGDKAVFEMSGNSVIKSSSGYSVNVDKGGIFQMSGGTITKNQSDGCIRVNGTFNMTGGVISENKATYGAGVFVDVNGHFTMSGNSLITSNSASSAGGGVYLKKPTDSDPEYTGGTFTMNGGTISDNKLTGYNGGHASLGYGDGGGVWVGDTCTFNMNGGTITGNRSTHLIYHDISDYNDRDWHVGLGGVFVSDKATFNLSGPSQIYGNLIGDKPESISPRVESDVVLGGSARINVTGDLTGAYIGLMHSVPRRSSYIDGYDSADDFEDSEVMTTGYSTYNPDVHPMAYFFSDVDGFAVVKQDGQAEVLRHTHNFTYTLNAAGDTLSASCSGCNIGNVFIKISAAGGAYTGQPFPATLTVRPEFRMLTDGVLDEESIVYLKDGQSLDSVPTEIGNYTAKCTVPIGDAEYTVSVDYSITAPVHECVWAFQNFTWTEDQSSATGYTAVANYKCSVSGCSKTNTVNAVITPETLPAATCVAQTVTLTASVEANDSLDGAQHTDTKDVTVPANGPHSWTFVDFTWTADESSATGYTAVANYKCSVSGCNGTDTVNAVITPETLPAAICVAQTVTLTAAVKANNSLDGAQHTDTKDVTVPANGPHSWTFVDFTWTADESSATGYTAVANYKCSVSGCNGTDTVNAVITPETLPAAICVAQTVTLTATVDANNSLDGAQHTDTKDATVPANGPHSWAFVDFTWTADESSAVGYTAAANYKCSVNGCNATNTVDAVISPETLLEKKCVEAQSMTLTANVEATVSLDGVQHTDEKEISVPAYGSHDMGAWFETQTPTCTETGLERRNCSRCDYYETRTVKANGHTMGAWVETKAPTCTEEGEERSDCANCDYYETHTVKANGHTMGAWVESKAPTCTEEGEERSDCANCSYYETRTVKTVGHAMGAWVETKAPTCTKAGEESRSCANCTVTETRPVAKLGHNWGEWIVTKEATCTEEGTETRTCRRDALHTETRTIPTVAHTDADGDNLCDNCGETVKEAFRCGFCDKYEAWKDIEYFGLIVSIVHFFVHLAQHISYIT